MPILNGFPQGIDIASKTSYFFRTYMLQAKMSNSAEHNIFLAGPLMMVDYQFAQELKVYDISSGYYAAFLSWFKQMFPYVMFVGELLFTKLTGTGFITIKYNGLSLETLTSLTINMTNAGSLTNHQAFYFSSNS